MPMLMEEFVKSEVFSKLPGFIKNHPVFAEAKQIKKIFPSIGLPNGGIEKAIKLGDTELDLVFASTDFDGLWDLATMSMRGVISCMHWDNREKHAKHLVGSVVDPYCAIIYLTDNTETPFGRTINKRSLVRYVLHEGKPALFIEKIYTKNNNVDPKTYHINNEAEPKPILDLFIEYLGSRSKLPILDYLSHRAYYGRSGIYIPYPAIYRKLTSTYYSMSDFCISYIEGTKDSEIVKQLGFDEHN